MANTKQKGQNQQNYLPWGLRGKESDMLRRWRAGDSYADIARDYGTSRETIRNAVARALVAEQKNGTAATSGPGVDGGKETLPAAGECTGC